MRHHISLAIQITSSVPGLYSSLQKHPELQCTQSLPLCRNNVGEGADTLLLPPWPKQDYMHSPKTSQSISHTSKSPDVLYKSRVDSSLPCMCLPSYSKALCFCCRLSWCTCEPPLWAAFVVSLALPTICCLTSEEPISPALSQVCQTPRGVADRLSYDCGTLM